MSNPRRLIGANKDKLRFNANDLAIELIANDTDRLITCQCCM